MSVKNIFLVATCLIVLGASSVSGFQLTFQPRISFGVEYTDNVFLDPDNVGEIEEDPNLEPESDSIFVTTPGFTAEMLGRQNGLSLSYDFGYSKYNEFSNNDNWRHDLDLSIWSEFSRDKRLEFTNTYLYTEDPLGGRTFEVTEPPDSDTPTDPTTVGTREPYWVNTANLRFEHAFGQEKTYFLNFSNIYREDDNELGNNSNVNIPSAGLTYWFGAHWGTEIEGSYTWGEYENAPDIGAWYNSLRVIRRISNPLQFYLQSRQGIVDQKGTLEEFPTTTRRNLEDWNIYDVQLGSIYSPSSSLTLEASGGVVYYDPDLADEETEFIGTLDITKTFRQGETRIYAARGYGEDVFITRSDLGPALFSELGLSGQYMLTRYVTLNAFFGYQKVEYDADQRALPDEEEGLERTDDVYGAGAGISYTLRSWVSLDFDYAYQKLESTEESETYDENRVTFYVTFTSPREFTTDLP